MGILVMLGVIAIWERAKRLDRLPAKYLCLPVRKPPTCQVLNRRSAAAATPTPNRTSSSGASVAHSAPAMSTG